jgi:hypothetical protein
MLRLNERKEKLQFNNSFNGIGQVIMAMAANCNEIINLVIDMLNRDAAVVLNRALAINMVCR